MTGADSTNGGVRELAAAHRDGCRAIGDTVDALISAINADSDSPIWISRETPESLRARAAELQGGPRDLPLLGVPFDLDRTVGDADGPVEGARPCLHRVAVAEELEITGCRHPQHRWTRAGRRTSGGHGSCEGNVGVERGGYVENRGGVLDLAREDRHAV